MRLGRTRASVTVAPSDGHLASYLHGQLLRAEEGAEDNDDEESDTYFFEVGEPDSSGFYLRRRDLFHSEFEHPHRLTLLVGLSGDTKIAIEVNADERNA